MNWRPFTRAAVSQSRWQGRWQSSSRRETGLQLTRGTSWGWKRAGAHARSKQQQTALKRSGEPEDVAAAVLFLVRDAPYVTGQIIAVDGGRSVGW